MRQVIAGEADEPTLKSLSEVERRQIDEILKSTWDRW